MHTPHTKTRSFHFAAGALAAGILGGALAQAAPLDLGVYEGGGRADLVPSFESWFGYQVPRALDFYSNSNWTDLQDNSWLLNSWKGKRWAMTFSISMLPGDGSGTLAAGAAGSYDAYWTKIAQNLVNAGFGSATCRIGWEFNGGWYKWAANSDKTSWVTYWQRLVTAMRAVPGANFKFDWCPANGYQQFPADQVYPGDAYVDIVGLDVYNQSWISNYTDPVARWNDIYNADHGVRYWLRFAIAHNKPISFPEWGSGTRPDGHGGGDDPNFIQNMYNVITTAPKLAYHDYWDYPASDYNAKISNGGFPNEGAMFKSLFGNSFATGKYSARTFETDVAQVAVVSGATHSVISDNNLTYATGASLAATGSGQYVNYTIPNVPAGPYDVRVRVRKTPGSGQFELWAGRADNFSGTASKIGATQDEYSGSWAYTEIDLGTWTPGTTSDKQFQFKVVGKNASSTGYGIVIDYVKLTPQ